MAECPSKVADFAYRRRKEMQVEVAHDREYKKLETVWKNRGLPVDSLFAASEDAFDMRSLHESLPSTSDRKPTDEMFRCHFTFKSFNRYNGGNQMARVEKISRKYQPRTLPEIDSNLPMEKDIKTTTLREIMQKSQKKDLMNKSNEDFSLSFESYGEGNETSKESEFSFVRNSLRSRVSKGQEMNKGSDLNIRKMDFFNEPYETSSAMFLGDEKEKKTKEQIISDLKNNLDRFSLENNLGGFSLPPIPNLCQCSCRNSKMVMVQLRASWLRRMQKLRYGSAKRSLTNGDMNGPGTENPSIKLNSVSYGWNPDQDTLKKEYSSFVDQLILRKQRLSQARTSAKNFRTCSSRSSRDYPKSDKVVPD